MADKQPSFGDRVQEMQALAGNLTAMANLLLEYAKQVAGEASRMAAAQQRFSARRTTRKEAR